MKNIIEYRDKEDGSSTKIVVPKICSYIVNPEDKEMEVLVQNHSDWISLYFDTDKELEDFDKELEDSINTLHGSIFNVKLYNTEEEPC